jgi:flagellar biosynthesis/type III secretory pathway chaperone
MTIIDILTKQLSLHKSLHDLSRTKTEVVKKGDGDRLLQLVKDEQKHLYAMKQLEDKRDKEMRLISGNRDNPTLSELLPTLAAEERETLIQLRLKLTEEIKALKETNKLNEQLIEQSLQFVNLSLDLLHPQLESFNYGRPEEEEVERRGRSIFDSKA